MAAGKTGGGALPFAPSNPIWWNFFVLFLDLFFYWIVFFLSFLPSRRIVPILNSFNFRSYSYFFTVFFVNRLTYSY